MKPSPIPTRRGLLTAAAVALTVLAGSFALSAAASSEAKKLPPFAAAEPAALATATAASETAVLAGGCFWGVQGVFQHVKGVSNAVSGYAGGDRKTANYEAIGSGMTGHAEAVQITYDPRQVSYARLLQIYFSVVHDPTQLNRQGPDTGSQYRSAVFPVNEQQAAVAKAYIEQLGKTRIFSSPLVTKIEPGRTFYAAEDYHQDFLTRNPRHPYIVVNDLPKIDDLKTMFPELYRPEAALVAKAKKAGPSL